VFDHLLAILPELGLRLYQQPSGADIGAGGQGRGQALRHDLARERALAAGPDAGMR